MKFHPQTFCKSLSSAVNGTMFVMKSLIYDVKALFFNVTWFLNKLPLLSFLIFFVLLRIERVIELQSGPGFFGAPCI